MSDAIQGVMAVEKSAAQTMTLKQSIDNDGYSAQVADQTANAARGALEVGMSYPGGNMTPLDVQEGIMSGSNSAVDTEKDGLVVDHAKNSKTVEETLHHELTLQTKQLYIELGRWNIAWAVAKRIQRDGNQIMRGQ